MQQPTGEFGLGFTPSAPVEIDYEAGDLIINYQMDKLNFDLKAANGNLSLFREILNFPLPSTRKCALSMWEVPFMFRPVRIPITNRWM